MFSKIGLLVMIAIFSLTQSVSFAQDSAPSNASSKTYLIKGYTAISKILGSFRVNNLNNNEFIDKSELSDFILNFNDGNTNFDCTLSTLTKFQISDFQLRRFIGKPIPASLLSLDIVCQSKNAEFSLSATQLKSEIKIQTNSSQIEIPIYALQIEQSKEISNGNSGDERVSLNESFILTKGKNAKIYPMIAIGKIVGYKISMLSYRNNRASIKIEKFEEYPHTLSSIVGNHTLSIEEPDTTTPSGGLILGEEYAIKFLGFTRTGGVELKVLYVNPIN